MGSVWDFRFGLDAAVTAPCDVLKGLAPGQIDSRAMTEAVADSDSFVSPDHREPRPRLAQQSWASRRNRQSAIRRRYILAVVDLETGSATRCLSQARRSTAADDEQVGTVAHVLAAEHEDIFEGIVIAEHHGKGGHRFADEEVIDEIHERGVLLKLDRVAAEQLPEPTANPAVMYDDPTDSGGAFHGKLRRAWDLISGKY